MATDPTPNKPVEGNCGKDPAPQPPKMEPSDKCKPIEIGLPDPCRQEPPECTGCCECPPTPGDKPGCLEDLIKLEADAIAKGEQAKKFKSDLEALVGKVKDARLEYTADSYKDLVERWKKEDDAIVCLIRSIECALPCWWCVIECEICRLVNDVRRLELQLSGDFVLETDPKPAGTATPPPCFRSLYDLRHWWDREKRRRQALFDHLVTVMKAWERPFNTIDGVLKANAELLKNASATLNIDQKKDASKILFDLVRLIRLHLAIAPPADSPDKTKIDKRYVDFCGCDATPPLHECCGVVIRMPTVLDRVIGPQPYLIRPELYPDLICCLATKVFQPAKQKAVEAESKWSEFDTEIKTAEAAIAAQIKDLPANAKVRLAKTIDCEDYDWKTGTDGKKRKCCNDPDPPPPPPPPPPPCDDGKKTDGDDPGQTGNPAQQAN